MFGRKKGTDRRILEKERKKGTTRKYGRTQLKHSRMGTYSCYLAGGALILILSSVLTAFFMRGKTVSLVGGLGVMSILFAAFGIRAAIKGLRERERNYITCRVGLAANIVILLGLIVIFFGGLF